MTTGKRSTKPLYCSVLFTCLCGPLLFAHGVTVLVPFVTLPCAVLLRCAEPHHAMPYFNIGGADVPYLSIMYAPGYSKQCVYFTA